MRHYKIVSLFPGVAVYMGLCVTLSIENLVAKLRCVRDKMSELG